MHGPVVRSDSGKWISVRMMQEPVKALTQSYTRTKATSYKAFRESMELHTNSSNNTIFADADGDIAYFHANHVPIRDTHFDWRKPVDGSNPATDWKGITSIDSSPHLLNPPNGWLYNSQQLAVFGGGPVQPEEVGLSRLHGQRHREPARRTCDTRALEQEGLHAAVAHRRRVRQLPARVRRSHPDTASRRTTQHPRRIP